MLLKKIDFPFSFIKEKTLKTKKTFIKEKTLKTKKTLKKRK